jgi:hypothetical protein
MGVGVWGGGGGGSKWFAWVIRLSELPDKKLSFLQKTSPIVLWSLISEKFSRENKLSNLYFFNECRSEQLLEQLLQWIFWWVLSLKYYLFLTKFIHISAMFRPVSASISCLNVICPIFVGWEPNTGICNVWGHLGWSWTSWGTRNHAWAWKIQELRGSVFSPCSRISTRVCNRVFHVSTDNTASKLDGSARGCVPLSDCLVPFCRI